MIILQKKYWYSIIILFIGLGIVLLTYFNTNYQSTIAVVTQAKKISAEKVKDQYDNTDHEITQKLTLKVLNHQHRGQSYHLKNTYEQSQLEDQKYHKNQRVFVQVRNGQLTISNVKRDWVIILMIFTLILLMVILIGAKSWLVLMSLLLNTVIFYVVIHFDIQKNGSGTIMIYSLAAIIFATVSFLLYQGIHKKMWAMLTSTIVALLLSFGLCYLIMRLTNERGITYMAVEYATQNPRSLFIGQTLLGVLGAVMDESTDIVSSLSEIIYHNPKITGKQLWHSGRAIGQEIMGPLINVLFLIFMADALPMTILYLRNNNTIAYTFEYTLSLGVLQSLISAIGIVLTVPTATICAYYFLIKKEGHQ